MMRPKSAPVPRAALLEPLEPRLLLSGTVTTALAGGNLTITGYAEANNITVTKAANTVTIVANDGETLAGLGGVVDGVTGDIFLHMGAGADSVVLGEVGGTFWVGDETAPAPWPNRQNPRSLLVDLGLGEDRFWGIGLVARNATIGGHGPNQIFLRDNGGDTQATDACRILNGLFIQGLSTLVLSGVTVGQNVIIKSHYPGDQEVIIEDSTAATFGSWIGGGVLFTGSTHNDVVVLGDTEGGATTVVRGSVAVLAGGADPDGGNAFILGNAQIGGNLLYVGGNEPDLIEFTEEGPDRRVGGNAVFQAGNGHNVFRGSVGVGRNLLYLGGSGDDLLGTDGEGPQLGLWVGGHVGLNLGAGHDTARLDALVAGGHVAVNLAQGNNMLECTSAVTIGGHFAVSAGSGDDDVWVDGLVSIGGNMAVNLAGGNNEFRLLIEGEEIGDAFGELALLMVPIRINGQLTYFGGQGTDSVLLAAPQDKEDEGIIKVFVGRNAMFVLGGGTNELIIGKAGVVQVGGSFGYVGGVGDDTLAGADETALLAVGDHVGILAGHGTNRLELNVLAGGHFAYAGGSGNDTLMGWWGVDPADGFGFAVTLLLGAGSGPIGGNVGLTLGGGTNTVTPTDIQVRGNVQITGGAGNDTIHVVDGWIGRGLGVLAGQGENAFTVENGLAVGERLLYLGGSGVDALGLASTVVGGQTSIGTGDGQDTIAIGAGCSFAAFTLNTGAQNDTVDLGTELGPTLTVFTGSVVADLGAGDDTLTVGHGVVGALPTSFTGLTVTLTAGPGTDSLTIAGAEFVFTPTLGPWEVLVL